MWRMQFEQFQHDPRFEAMFGRVPRRPRWVWSIALLAAAVVIVVPLLLLALAGLIVGTIAFFILSFIWWIVSALQSVTGPRRTDNGRRNVRVIDSD